MYSEFFGLNEKPFAITPDPRIKVTAFEKTIGQNYTARTLEIVRARNPGVHFV